MIQNRYDLRVDVKSSFVNLVISINNNQYSKIELFSCSKPCKIEGLETTANEKYHRFSSDEFVQQVTVGMGILQNQKELLNCTLSALMIADWLSLYFHAPAALNINSLLNDEIIPKYTDVPGVVPDIYFPPYHVVESMATDFQNALANASFIGKLTLNSNVFESYFMLPIINQMLFPKAGNDLLLLKKVLALKNARIQNWKDLNS